MVLGGGIDYFIDTVFNYPTLAECYKAAAFNGLAGWGATRRDERWMRPTVPSMREFPPKVIEAAS